MGKKKHFNKAPKSMPTLAPVDSLLDKMQDGNEYGSIVSLTPKHPDLIPELRRALKEVETIRGRPCVCYIGNVVRPSNLISIETSDDLPFNEMIEKLPSDAKEVDVLVVTPGGSGQQVSQFVNTLRTRFSNVEYILPYMCMSAGTLWVLSGDKIWMEERSFIGPIDPQVLIRDGRFVPAQSLLVLIKEIQKSGEEAIKNGQQPPWSYIRLLANVDPRLVGDAMTLSDYSIKMASEFLEQYKFRNWHTHSTTGKAVTDTERRETAIKAAKLLCEHEYWKSHAHGITREVAEKDLKIQIDKMETQEGLERSVRRLWALLYYVLDKSAACKVLFSQDYAFVRNATMQG